MCFEESPMGNKLYVGNLPFTRCATVIWNRPLASSVAVTSAKVMMERDTGRSKGFGLWKWAATPKPGRHQRHEWPALGGRSIVVNEARPHGARPPPRSGGFGGGGGGYGGGGAVVAATAAAVKAAAVAMVAWPAAGRWRWFTAVAVTVAAATAAVAAAKAASRSPTVQGRATAEAAAAMAAVAATVAAATAATESSPFFLSKGPLRALFVTAARRVAIHRPSWPSPRARPHCISVWRRLRGRPARHLVKQGLGSMRNAATTPICQGMTR